MAMRKPTTPLFLPLFLVALSLGVIMIAGTILKEGGEIQYFVAGGTVGSAVAIFAGASIELWKIWKSRR